MPPFESGANVKGAGGVGTPTKPPTSDIALSLGLTLSNLICQA